MRSTSSTYRTTTIRKYHLGLAWDSRIVVIQQIALSNNFAMTPPSDPPGRMGSEKPIHPNPYATEVTPEGAALQVEDTASHIRLLREIIDGSKPPADLSKGSLMLDRDDVGEEAAEV